MSAWHSVHRHWQPQGPTSRLLCVNISSFCVRPYCYRRLRAPRMMAVRGVCRPDALSVRTRPTGISCPPSSGLKFSALRQQPRHLRPSEPSSAPTRAIACPIATVCACPNVETVGFSRQLSTDTTYAGCRRDVKVPISVLMVYREART